MLSVASVTPHPGNPSSTVRPNPFSTLWPCGVIAVGSCSISGDSPCRKSCCWTVKSGSSARIGMTAISWVNKTAKIERPPRLLIKPRSDSVCSTIAVEDSARISPMTNPVAAGYPKAMAPSMTPTVVSTNCSSPSPSNRWRISQRARGLRLRPIRNSIITIPNSATCWTSLVSLPTNPRIGPMAMPAAR